MSRLDDLRDEVQHCTACELYKGATQAVFGAGLAKAEVMFVGGSRAHFHFSERGKRRIHERPRAHHIEACRPWLDRELEVVRPRVLVCLGATPAQALVGKQVKVTQDRGKPLESDLAPVVMVTVHPSSILRSRDQASREAAYEGFVADLELVSAQLAA